MNDNSENFKNKQAFNCKSSNLENSFPNNGEPTVLKQQNLENRQGRYWSKPGNSKKNENFPSRKWKNTEKKLNLECNSEPKLPEYKKESDSFLSPYQPYEPLVYVPQSADCTKKFQQDATRKIQNTVTKNPNHSNQNSKVKNFNDANEKTANNLAHQKIFRNKNPFKNQNWNQNSKICNSITSKNKMTMVNQMKQKKMRLVRKIRQKKAYSQSIRDKNQNLNKNIDIISIEESDNDEDDVICIPAPAPPLVAIDESDDEIKEDSVEDKTEKVSSVENTSNELVNKKGFTKPKKSISAPVSATQSNNSSRCTSPGSAFSADDFIPKKEKKKIFEVTIINDDDMIFTETVDSFVQRQNKSAKTNKQVNNTIASNMPPPSSTEKGKVKQNKNNKKTNYLVKQSCSRAIDVYDESESDFSVYSKGSISNNTETKKGNLVITSSSSSSVSSSEELIIQKIKRLRKRRSSSNKGSDRKISDESDSENDITKTNTGLSYISKGEAVEKVKKRRKSIQNSKSSVLAAEINSSDNEFIKKLNKIVHKTDADKINSSINSQEVETDISDEMEENITARKIAETVIEKTKKSNQIIDKEVTIQPTENIDEIIIIESNPNEDSVENLVQSNINNSNQIITEDILRKAFKEIDTISIKSDLCREKTPEMVNLDITQSDIDSDIEETNIEAVEDIEDILETNKITVDGVSYYRIDSHTTDNMKWCEEMYRFYNMSWGGEKFTVAGVKKFLDRKANWNINSADRYPKFSKFSRMKCFNCCEFGHIALKCSRPRKPYICYMCGEQGHREPRCPNTICLKCGSKTTAFTRGCKKCAFQHNQFCHICKISGHSTNYCPDKWRRYHSTVTPNTDPNYHVKYNNVKYCCVCANRGHLPEQCKYAKIFLEIQPSLSHIKSHNKSLQSDPNAVNLCKSTITYNLLYEPNDGIHFSFSKGKKFTETEYYGRFIKAVKLDQMLSKIELKSNDKEIKKSKKKCYIDGKEIGQKQSIIEDNLIYDEHKFKPPNKVGEKIISETDVSASSSNENLKNLSIISSNENQFTKKDTTSVTSKDIVFDSDSNYSFSDHFDVPKSSTPLKIVKKENASNQSKESDFSKPQIIYHPMGDTPDFIPLNNSNTNILEKASNMEEEIKQCAQGGINARSNNFQEFESNQDFIRFDGLMNCSSNESDNEISDYNKTLGISYKLRLPSESDCDESSFPDISSVGKIFLPKNFSDYLLSPNGNKFLIDNSNKYNIKSSIDWTSVGNVLVLEGLKSDQNQFHIQLMLELRSLPSKLKNVELEKSIRVPKKRSVLIKFLQEDLERLDSKIGNVDDLHKQLKNYEFQQSKNGLKQAQKIRTKINMILFGQAGLCDGKNFLELLIKHLIKLLQNNTNSCAENVENQVRDEINKSWKYIFSPLEHSNYDELIDKYYDMKRHNNLPLLKIRDRIKNYNITFDIDVVPNELKQSITEKNEIQEIDTDIRKRKSPSKDESNEINELPNKKIPKLFNDNNQQTKLDVTKISPKLSNEVEILLNNINNNFYNTLKIGKSATMSSPFWSKESLNSLKQILEKNSWDTDIELKFRIALNRARKGLLSHSDYRNINLIKNQLK